MDHAAVSGEVTSGRASVVVLEQTTKSFTAFDFASNRTSITVRLNQLIAESLMIPLTVVMLDVFTNGLLERSPSEEDHTIKALGLETAKPSLHISVQVGTLRWQQDDFGIAVLIEKFAYGDEARVSIDDQMTGVFQESVFAIGEIAADLFHPRGIRTWRDACDLHTACLQVHHGKHVERHQSVSRPDFRSREVRGKDGFPVGLQERGPRWCSLADRVRV